MNTIYEADGYGLFGVSSYFKKGIRGSVICPKLQKIVSSEFFFNLQYVHHSFAYKIADRRHDLKVEDCYYS